MKKNNNTSFLTIPCHWNKEVIKKILQQNECASIPVREVYGSLAFGCAIGHGRSPESVININKKDAVEFRKFLGGNGLDFTYLINAPCEDDFLFLNKESVDKYLSWILNILKPDAITVASPGLARCIRSIDDSISLHISTIAGIHKKQDFNIFEETKPDRVVPHHDCGKHWSDLRGLVSLGKNKGFSIELLSTESCLLGCPRRSAHYAHLAAQKKDCPFHTTCNTAKIINPCEFLLAGGCIRPEDVVHFEKMGVKYFKISGRSKPPAWLPETVRAYQERGYAGNLIRLLGIDPSLNAEDWIYINNKSLDGFILNFPQTGNRQDETKYCDMWITKLYKDGNFKLLDGTIYEIKNDKLILKNIGSIAKQIISCEQKKC
jgi:collagenase-like PrtC family protease